MASAPEEEDRCIYFRVQAGEEMYWYVIRGDSKTPESVYLKPIFEKNKTDQKLSAVAAVGSLIYVFGGGNYMTFDLTKCEYYDGRVNSVYCIDTNHPETTGWVKYPPMKHRRARFIAVPINERKEIYVFKGRLRIYDAEVYNRQSKTWRHLEMENKPILSIPGFTCHAVLEGGKKVLLFSRSSDRLFSYDVEKNLYSIERPRICGKEFVNTIAVSDEVLYMAGYNLPSCIMALEVNKLREGEPKIISGLVEREGGLPLHTRTYATLVHVVEIAKNRLALLWGLRTPEGIDYNVHCIKLSISKDPDGAGGFTFKAHSITKSIYYVKGGRFDDQVLSVDTSFWNDKDPEEMKENHKPTMTKKKKEKTNDEEEGDERKPQADNDEEGEDKEEEEESS